MAIATLFDQIENKDGDFCNFRDEQIRNVIKLTPNFELELEIYPKKPIL
jgi:hypothetical protein